MSRHNSKILKVYQQCQKILNLKRRFIQEINIPSIPKIKNPQSSSIKQFCTAYYIKFAICKFLRDSSQIYSLYKNQDTGKQVIEKQIESNIKRIKNTKQLTTKHQQLQIQLDQIKKKWQGQESLVYYEINQRIKLKNLFTQKFNVYKQSQSDLKTIKNPHFVHQLINQLKQNLQKISQQDKKYDNLSQQNTQKITKFLKQLSFQMQTNINDITYGNYIFQQKKKFFSQFIQISDIKSIKNKNNITKNYFDQLILISKDIKSHYKSLIQFIDDLINFFKQIEIILKTQIKKADRKYQNFIQEVFRNKQISIILRVDIQQRINNNYKAILGIGELARGLPSWLKQYKTALVQCYSQANSYHEKYINQQIKFKPSEGSFEKMLIQHKGYFSILQKKYEKYNKMNIETLKKLVKDLHQLMKTAYYENLKQARSKAQINVHQSLNRIFSEYDFREQKNQLNESKASIQTSNSSSNSNIKAKIRQYEDFINSIQIFDCNSINWNNGSYACSLGPKLLLHGYLQALDQGIYYESSFNKKNYFFGKTKLFIPKTDIYEINKQIVLLVFPDVIQIKTNKGQIYFHALGKRDKMYENFIQTYFPQVPQSQNGADGQIQYEFNDFKGQQTKDRPAFKIQHLPIDLGSLTLKNCDLRVLFRRYFSDDSFTYQGAEHQNFKVYALKIVDCLKPQTNQITPSPPYYFLKKGQSPSSQVPEYSIRLAKFQKKVPTIPFVSKGGVGLCEQKSIYHWGSSSYFVIQIQNIMKGFPLTQGMIIKMRSMFKHDKQLNQVKIIMTGDVVFQKQGALNGTIKSQAIQEFKQVIRKTYQVIQKNEKNRSIYKNKGNKLQKIDEEKQQFKDQIEKLKHQNQVLNKKIKILVVLFLVFYFITILLLNNWGESKNIVQENKKITQINQQKGWFQQLSELFNGLY